MSAPRLRSIASSLLLLVAPAFAVAQQAPAVRDLPRPTREIEDPYSLVAAVREISGGKVIVVDGIDGEVSVVTFATGERSALGRQGSGPGEYKAPGSAFGLRGDTIWIMDPGQQRMAVFLPDLKAGVPFQLQMFDNQTRTALMAPFQVDSRGLMYANGLPVSGPNMQIPDSVEVFRFDPRATGPRTAIAKVRFPTSGTPQMRIEGQVIKYTMAFPGLVTADSWVVFPDGRAAVVHGSTYTVEFIAADGRRTTARPITYDRIPVTSADHEAEMTEAKRVLAEQTRAVARTMPPGMTLDINMTPPESWPSVYPSIAPLQAYASPDGRLWVQRSTPARLNRQHWDVIDANGALVARWRLPVGVRLMGVGSGVVYTVRVDEDDLQYIQRIEVGR